RGGKLLARDQHGIDRDDLVHVAMDQENRRTVAGLLDRLDAGKRTGVADDRRRRGFACKAYGEREHGALTEADKSEGARGELHALKFGIEKGIHHRARLGNAVHNLARIAERQIEPLPSHRRHAAWLWRMGGDKRGMRQRPRPFAAQRDQVVAVGTIAVKEHDELFGLTTGRRGYPRSVETRRQAQAPSSGMSSAECALSWP